MIEEMQAANYKVLTAFICLWTSGLSSVKNDFVFAPLEVPRLRRDLELIKEDCGDVCDTSEKKYGPMGKYYQIIKKNFECQTLIDSPMFDKLATEEAMVKDFKNGYRPPARQEIPEDIVDLYTYHGRVPILHLYMDNSDWTAEASPDQFWSQELIEEMRLRFREDKLAGLYGLENVKRITAHLRDHMLDRVEGGHVLVIGTQEPWLEVVLLELGASFVTTLEYTPIKTDHPQLNVITPDTMRVMFKDDLDSHRFDAVVSHSSLEHSGLGRYGDSLNPWADLITMARAWCLTKPGGRALIGVPTGFDGVMFNSNKIYGPLQYSHLFANWDQIYTEAKMYKKGRNTTQADSFCEEDESIFYCYEPLHVLQKPFDHSSSFHSGRHDEL